MNSILSDSFFPSVSWRRQLRRENGLGAWRFAQDDESVENALENINYSFFLFCMKNSFVSKYAVLKFTS